MSLLFFFFFFFFNDPATTEIYTLSYTLSLHDALPICGPDEPGRGVLGAVLLASCLLLHVRRSEEHTSELQSHSENSYAVFCLKKKSILQRQRRRRQEHRELRDGNVARRQRLRDAASNDRFCAESLVHIRFFFNDTATPEIYTLSYTLSLHDALPISCSARGAPMNAVSSPGPEAQPMASRRSEEHTSELQSHSESSYAVLCLKKKRRRYAQYEFLCGRRSWQAGRVVLPAHYFENPMARPFGLAFLIFFFNDTATTEIYTLSYTLSLHDALPISPVTFRNLVCRLLLVTGEIGRAHVCSSHIQKSRMPSSL